MNGYSGHTTLLTRHIRVVFADKYTLATAYSPVWTAVLPEGAAPGQQEGYLLPVPGSSASTPQAAVASLNVSQDAQTIGGLTNATAQFGSNNYLGQLEVNGGYVYVPAGAGATLPTAAFQSFLHSTTKGGFTGLFFDIILAVFTAVTFGAAAPLTIGMGVTMAAAGGAMGGFLTGVLFDVVANGGPGFTNIQEHLVGGNCAGSNQKCLTGPPVAMNLNSAVTPR